jgi:hypothetical protein
MADGAGVFFEGAGGETRTVVFQGAGDEAAAFDLTFPDAPVLLTGAEIQSGTMQVGADVGSGTVLIAADPGDFSLPDSVSPASPGRLVGSVLGGDKLWLYRRAFWREVERGRLEEELGGVPWGHTEKIYDEFGTG